MIDVAMIERLDDKAKLVLFVFAFLGLEHSASLVCEAAKKAEASLSDVREVNALCQRLEAAGILQCVQSFRYGRDSYYKLNDTFAPSALSRLVEISVARNWWIIFG